MRKIVSIITIIIMLTAMTSGWVYGETSITQPGAGGNGITQADINEGLNICKSFPVSLKLDGKQILFESKDVPPVIIKERTLIPARALFEAMGGTVVWENDTQSVHVKYDDTEVVLTIGSNQAWVNGEIKQLELPAMILDPDGDYYGSTMIPVRFTAEALGCTVGWDDPARSVIITSPSKSDGSNGGNNTGDGSGTDNSGNTGDKDQNTNNPNVNDQNTNDSNNGGQTGNWQFEQLNEAARGKLVVIDIGHGGKDSGSIGHENKPDQLYEKDVNLKAGLRLNEYLKSAGVSTYMIRETDVYYTLLERAGKANDLGATLFVSVHNNSNESATPHGTEVLYNSKVNAEGKSEMELYGIESKNIAKNVQDEMVKNLGTHNRGIKSSPGMAVLNKTSMPAIIVEGAFLSNENNFAMMKDPGYADKYALSVAKGIVKSLNEAFK